MQAHRAAADDIQIGMSNLVPKDIDGGAANASIQEAAAFSWQEFIALNWPARLQTGAAGDRDAPATDCKFGDPACASRPLTWQTFRGKAEIFTAGAVQQYDRIPTYSDVYSPPVSACDGGPNPAQGAWVNLDETSEITLDSMYAGVGPPQPTRENSAPQLVRFMAKANRAEFDYVQKIGAVNGPSRTMRAATVNYFKTVGDPAPGSTQYVSLPDNTIEIKAGWRILNPGKEDPKRFHTARVRYYEGSAGGLCYREAVWALVSLHIIQKTPSAPYFIYATFEQADNILTPDGRRTEDEDGRVVAVTRCRSDQTTPCPTTPSVTLNDTGTVAPGHIPPNVTTVPGTTGYCTPSLSQRPANQAYYLNTAEFKGLPGGGYVCVNSRDNPIPQAIIEANAAAHRAIARYNQANGIGASPWSYYKLVNVQYVPIDKDQPGPYGGSDWNSGRNPASFYLANIMVETNRPLQLFSGGLVGTLGGIGGTGSNSDYASQFGESGGGTHKNTYFNKTGYNMGGCLGCHGSQGQSLGGDFSVILARGVVGQPEPVPEISTNGAKLVAPKSRRLAFRR